MPRFFTALTSARPLEVGGRSFSFEPVTPLGGGWLGVLAVDDESAASILAANADVVTEITAEEYDRLKKKLNGMGTPPVSSRLPTPPPALQRLVPPAAPAEQLRSSTGPESPTAAAAKAEVPAGPSVELQMTDKEPPAEPLLDIAPKKKSRKKEGK